MLWSTTRPGWNPSRRNRNIGTAKSGHGQNNRLVIPARWSDDRVFWEKLRDPIAVERRTPLGSLVVCGDRQLLVKEAPTAYKRIEQVIADLVDHDLATPVATTVPLVTCKTPDLGSTPQQDRRDHRRKRGRP